MPEGSAKLLAVTMGDPYSINVYAMASLLAPLLSLGFPVVLIGSHWHWRHQMEAMNLSCGPLGVVRNPAEIQQQGLHFWDIASEGATLPADQLAAVQRGDIAVRSLMALESLRGYDRIAVLTCPIDKSACAMAGFSYPGHTEFFCERWGKGEGIMILAGPRLRIGLVTNHVAVRCLAKCLNAPLIAAKLAMFADALRETFGIAVPRIAVCGFNPHCSDHGLFGDEEELILQPAIEHFLGSSHKNVIVHGPVPADTAFYRGYHGGYDGVLAMYHDQGLAPLKTVHFDEAVNITGGLSVFRVSPDHGPARDLYLKSTASLASYQMALSFCLRYLEYRLPGGSSKS